MPCMTRNSKTTLSNQPYVIRSLSVGLVNIGNVKCRTPHDRRICRMRKRAPNMIVMGLIEPASISMVNGFVTNQMIQRKLNLSHTSESDGLNICQSRYLCLLFCCEQKICDLNGCNMVRYGRPQQETVKNGNVRYCEVLRCTVSYCKVL